MTPLLCSVSRLGLAVASLVLAAGVGAQTGPVGAWSDVFAYPGARLSLPSSGYDGAPATVRAVALDGAGGAYVGGQFTSVDGVAATAIAHWTGQAWEPVGGGLQTSYPAYQSPVVNDVLRARDGSVYVVGEFSQALQRTGRAVSANGIVRWTGSAWESVGGGLQTSPYTTASGRALAEGPDGSIYVAGPFEAVIGADGVAVPAAGVARWHDGRWSAVDAGGQGTGVDAVAVADDGTVALAGAFALTGPYENRAGVLLLRPDGTRRQILEASGVASLAWSGGALYAAGYFYGYGTSPVLQHVGRWDGQTWDALDGGANSSVYRVVGDGAGGVYAVGSFTMVGIGAADAVAASGVAHWTGGAWTADGGVLSPEASYEFPQVFGLAVDGGDLVVGGVFEGVRDAGGAERSAASVAVRRGGAWGPLSRYSGAASLGRRPSVFYGRSAVLTSTASPCGRGVVVGGRLPTVGTEPTADLGLWDGRAWTAFPGRFSFYGGSTEVQAVVGAGCDGGRPQLFVAGPFDQVTVDGVAIDVDGVAYWDGRAWSALDGTAPEGGVRALAFDGQTLYAAGTLGQVGGGSYNTYGVYGWRRGRGWQPVGGPMEGQTNALAIGPDGALYVGGLFNTVRQPGGLSINVGGLVRWSGSAWEWIGNPTSGEVGALAFGPDGVLYVGGAFAEFAQPSRPPVVARNVAAWDGTAWADYGLTEPGVSSLAVGAAGRVYAGLSALPYSYAPLSDRLYVTEATGWRPLGVAEGSVTTLTLAGTDLYVGGTFTTAGPTPSAYLGLYVDPMATPTGGRPGGAALALSVAPNPTRGRTALTVDVPTAGPVRVAVYDALGREVAVLADGPRPAGPLALELDGARLPAGVYVARAVVGTEAATRRLTVVR